MGVKTMVEIVPKKRNEPMEPATTTPPTTERTVLPLEIFAIKIHIQGAVRPTR